MKNTSEKTKQCRKVKYLACAGNWKGKQKTNVIFLENCKPTALFQQIRTPSPNPTCHPWNQKTSHLRDKSASLGLYLEKFPLVMILMQPIEFFSIAGHAAYVVGTLCNIDLGRQRVLESVAAFKDSGYDILTNLTSLLYCKDGESIMNATGTIGTLVSL